MEFSGIQIAVSIIVIFGAAAAALLCDFLKRKNEQLREAMVELEMRREQAARRAANPARRPASERRPVVSAPVQSMEPATAPEPVMQRPSAPVVDRATAAVVAKVAANHRRANGQGTSNGHNGRHEAAADTLVRKPNSTARVPRPQFEAAELASVSGRRQAPLPPVTESLPKANETNSKEALADWLSRRAAARTAQPEQKTKMPASKPEPQVTATPNPAAPTTPVTVVIEPVISELIVESTASDALGLPEVHIDAFLWESLVSDKPVMQPESKPAPNAIPESQLQLIRSAASSSHELMVPAGMHDESFLARLLAINKPFTGLVVSIGVNENDGRAPGSEDLMRSAKIHIASLLGEKDFGCQTGMDEFILICSGEQGAEAQRRLSSISERLWDFQLRGLGTFSILFSWGGVDVQSEPLSDAVASATERMYQTKRSRKTVSMDSVSNRRKVV